MQQRLFSLLFPARIVVAACLALGAGCGSALQAPELPPVSVESMRKSVFYLASDELEGRGVGTEGLDLAAEYIAGYFRALGLQPAPGQNDHFQAFSHTLISGIAPESALRAEKGAYQAVEDFIPLGFSAEKSFDGPVAFVGYGISAPEYDDYAGTDVQGKVALALRFEPHDEDGSSRLAESGWSEHAALLRKARLAADHGAAALLVVHPPQHHDSEHLTPFTHRMGEALSIPVVQITQDVANDLLRAAEAGDLRTLQKEIDANYSPRSRILERTRVQGNVAFQRDTFELRNVTAYLPGKGPRARECIVVGAHYDHLGRGGFGSQSPRSNEIHNGADDNASGTAALLELARRFSQSNPLGRSLLFVAFTGEERGLLGSQHWVDNPPVPLERIAAMVNLDMVGRAKDDAVRVGGRGTAAAFAEILERADEKSPLGIVNVWSTGFAPSDNTSFVKKRIPVLFFFTGLHEDYHRPTDDADKINYAAMADIVDLAANVIIEISREQRLAFVESAEESPTTMRTPSTHGGGASLGVIPDYGSEDEAKGVRISGTMPGSPAAKAGLLGGDTIVELDGRKIDNIFDLTDALNVASPGATVPVRIIRNGVSHTLEATLAERRPRQ